MTNKLPEQLYRFIKREILERDGMPMRLKYSELAYLYVVELSAIYEAMNSLVLEDRIWYEAVGRPLGDGDYLVSVRVKE